MILVSACLLNHPVRYKGDGNPCPLLMQYADSPKLLAFCPECAGGLPTPRPPAEIRGGTGAEIWSGQATLINNQGVDVTAEFKSGAEQCLELCQKHHITTAILKQRSPSCGSKEIYDGTFSGTRIPGMGATAALLAAHGITIYGEEDITEELLKKLLEE